MRKVVLLAGLIALSASPIAAAPFKTANPPSTKTSGAPLFRSRDDVRACFARVFRDTSAGFKVCERGAKAIVPAGAALRILEKVDSEVVARVRVLDGKFRGTEGWIHEVWISPSPWDGR